MLNAGLSTLVYLKSRILPEASRDETTWDAALSRLGLAIAGRMERHCSRQFARAVGVTDEFSAWNTSVTLQRYPVEAITGLQLREPDGTLSDSTVTYGLDAACGLLDFLTLPGNRTQRLVITYTGGWWLDDGGDLPSGATALPEDVLETFIAEVQRHAESRGTFEALGLRAQKDAAKAVPAAGLSQECTDALRSYRRFAGE